MNWIAIIVATAAAMVIGYLWYGPVFGKTWMALTGRGMGTGQSAGPLYALTALAAFVEAIALNWFISAVRSPTSRSRARWSVCISSCSSLFNATKRIVGRVAASAMASASRSSFFCAFT